MGICLVFIKYKNGLDIHSVAGVAHKIIINNKYMNRNYGNVKALVMAAMMLAGAGKISAQDTTDALNVIRSKTIIFITGAFVTNSCWDEWRTWFESKGYHTSAPAWPCKDGAAAELRGRQPHDTALANLTLDSVISYFESVARKCEEKPVLIGHSLGGLIVQVLVSRGVAEAGVAIHSVPTKGVLPYERSSVRSIKSALGIFTSGKKTYMMPFSTWQYAFTNGMSPEEQRTAYENFTVPESRRVARGALSKVAAVDYNALHVPLLLTSGSDDNILPAHLNKRNFRRYRQNGSVITYKEFPGRNHFVLGQSTWKEDAQFILSWLEQHSGIVGEAAGI